MSWIISSILDQIPLWVYLVAAGLGLAATFYFFSPILIPLWNALPRWVQVVLTGGLVVIVAFVLGRRGGRNQAREEQKRRDAGAVKEREKIHDRVSKLPASDVDKRLDKWMRDK